MHSRQLLVLLLCFFCVSVAAAPSPSGTLRGHVTAPAGGGATAAQIRVLQWYFVSGEPRTICDKVIYTDDDGNFSVQLPPGVYDVFVSRGDSEPVAKKLKIISEKVTDFSPKLKGSRLAEFVE